MKTPHILVAMSQAGYDKFAELLTEDAILLTDQDLVPKTAAPCPHYAISATRMAEGLGHKMMANIIMIGFFTAITGAVSKKAAQDTILQSVPRGTEEKNTKAFNKGFDFGVSTLKARKSGPQARQEPSHNDTRERTIAPGDRSRGNPGGHSRHQQAG